MDTNYILPIISELTTQNNHAFKDIHIIIYSVEYQGKLPFLQILLEKNATNSLQFPLVKWNDDIDLIQEIQIRAKNSVESLVVNHYSLRDFEWKGFHIDINNKEEMYVLVDISIIDNYFHTYLSDSCFFVCLPDIINQGKLYNFRIDESVTTYFKCNLEKYIIQDNQYNLIPLPVMGYALQNMDKAVFTNMFGISEEIVFGVSSEDIVQNLRCYQLYTDFDEVIKYGRMYSEGNNIKWCINRIAVIGNSTCNMNRDITEKVFGEYDIVIRNNSTMVFKDYFCQVPLTFFSIG